jgi:hypothetical protein
MLPAHRQYYVTARDGPRTYFLAGPYDTHAEALAAVEPVRAVALDETRNASAGRAWFMAYGTSRGPAGLQTALGVVP